MEGEIVKYEYNLTETIAKIGSSLKPGLHVTKKLDNLLIENHPIILIYTEIS